MLIFVYQIIKEPAATDKPQVMKATEDRDSNFIGDGSFHADYEVKDFSQYTQIKVSVSKSATTESVYVTYENVDNSKSVCVRFSNHINTAMNLGDQLDGRICSDKEILYRLGLAERVFTPKTRLSIRFRQVAKAQLTGYEEAALTIKDMYAMGAGADLSEFTGKIAKGSNYLILGDKVVEEVEKTRNAFGQEVAIGSYTYIIK